ncbi:hypothetical protein C7425_104270 [Pantoea ananatis]|uniref:hypothetical protein n=1 Tax=Pantoea ananas TaxID=553 RepID=UPI000D70A82B|nr:hypothetical protein [Pantoea ananatis]PWV66543.1 hypothetical protein C7425_104270 [Pantoea ananatis]
MNKYVIFTKNGEHKIESKVLLKEAATSEVVKELKKNGFRKHIVEVEANDEREAVKKLNEHSLSYQKDLKEYSGNVVIISVVVIVIALIYLLRSWF